MDTFLEHKSTSRDEKWSLDQVEREEFCLASSHMWQPVSNFLEDEEAAVGRLNGFPLTLEDFQFDGENRGRTIQSFQLELWPMFLKSCDCLKPHFTQLSLMVTGFHKAQQSFSSCVWNLSLWHCKSVGESQSICCQKCSVYPKDLCFCLSRVFNLFSSGLQTKFLQSNIPCSTTKMASAKVFCH
jgi:hypothetical protein